MSIPTPDHNVTRDNQQQPPQWAVEAAKEVRISVLEDVEDCSDGWSGQDRFNAAVIAKHAPQPIPAPAAANEAEINRTPKQHVQAVEIDTAMHAGWVKDPQNNGVYVLHLNPEETRQFFDEYKLRVHRAILARDAERDALRARVAELDRPCGWPNCDPAKACIEKLQAAVRNGDQNLEALLDLRAQLKEATERADALRRECEQAREKQKELNRRCQHAESVIAKSGIMEGREQGPKNRSFGRALANYAAAQAYRERDEARAELQARCARLEEDGKRLRDALNFIVFECDWEEGTHTGDNRIGTACHEALAARNAKEAT